MGLEAEGRDLGILNPSFSASPPSVFNLLKKAASKSVHEGVEGLVVHFFKKSTNDNRCGGEKAGFFKDGAWNGRCMGGKDLNEDGCGGDGHGDAVIVEELPSCGRWGI